MKSKQVTSRHLAVRCLVKWEANREPVQPLIESLIHGSRLEVRDRHLAVMMVQGVLRQMQYLDGVISRYAKHRVAKMKPVTRMALRLGVYQLLFLDRIPDSAAVNETVKALKAEKQPRWIVNFVNGVLRAVSRNSAEGQVDAEREHVLNHPQWLVSRWQGRYGIEKTEEICRANNQEPPLTLRVNTLITDPETLAAQFADAGIDVQKGRYTPEALVIPSPAGPVAGLPGYDEGFFHVQDEAAQLVTMLLNPFCSGKYLDGCAGLGGKTVMLGQVVPAGVELLAVEPNKHRFKLLQENIRRMGLADKVSTFFGRVGDLLQNNRAAFHGVLVDAPCSGTGVIRRHPDIRWNRQPQGIEGYQLQQLEILSQAAELVESGGILVYATCSMEPEENEQLIEQFLAAHPDFSLTGAQDFLPAPAVDLVTKEGFFSSTPADGLDGFFGARLERS